MGLKGYRLWVMGQLDSTCTAPPQRARRGDGHLGVAAHKLTTNVETAILCDRFLDDDCDRFKGWCTGCFEALCVQLPLKRCVFNCL
jgi:hypothetical protein